MYNPRIFPPFDLFTNAALTVSGGETPSLTSDPIPVGNMSKIYVFVANSGASTNCVVTIKGKPSSDSIMESTILEFHLGAVGSETAKDGQHIDRCGIPGYIYATISNADPANAAEITVTMSRFR